MSDSEEEAFQSADEGDTGKSTDPQGQSSHQESKTKSGTSDGKVKEQQNTESPSASTHSQKSNQKSKNRNKKGKGKKAVLPKDGQHVKKEVIKNTTESTETIAKQDEHDESISKSNDNDNLEDTNALQVSELPVSTNDGVKSDDLAHSVSEEEQLKLDSDLEVAKDVSETGKDVSEESVEAVVYTSPQESVEPSMESMHSPDAVTDEALAEKKREDILDRMSKSADTKQSSSWGGWGWGSSLLSTATSSVHTFASQVGDGLHTVMETVDSAMQAPPPEEMAKAVTKESEAKEQNNENPDKSQSTEKKETDEEPSTSTADTSEKSSNKGWFSSLGVSTITKAVESTGKRVVSGSLDVLEAFGKKTMDVISETDPGFQKTKHLIIPSSNKPNLSDTLKEAKREAEENAAHEKELEETRKAHFGSLFDDYQGIAHLEALEMLSNQCEGKVQSVLNSLPDDKLATAKEELINIREVFSIGDMDDEEDDVDDHDFVKLVTEQLSSLHLGTTPDKLNKVHCKTREWIKDCQEEQIKGVSFAAKEIHQTAIQSMAEITASVVGQFHKAGELLLLQSDHAQRTFVNRATSLTVLTKILCAEIGILSSQFTQCLSTAADDSTDPDSVNPLITSVYLEATNSNTYIQDAFQLLLPVFQSAVLETYQ